MTARMRSARATAASSTCAAGTTWLTSPSECARAASIGSPVSVNSSATASGIRVLMNTPPPAANRPRLTSGRPNLAASEATTTSQPRSSSKPPATAVALAAPTMGTPISPWVKRAKPCMPSLLPPTEPPSAKARQVHAGGERLVTRAGQHDGPDVGVLLRLEHAEADRGQQLGVERIAGLGSVEPQHDDGAAPLGDQDRLGLRVSLGVAHQATTFLSRRSAIASAG